MDSRRLAYLKALEIDVWERRDAAARAPIAQIDTSPPTEVLLAPDPPSVVPIAPVAAPIAADSDAVGKMSWDELATAVRSCTKCPLHATRTNGVFGVGDPGARWLIIGEAP